MTRVHEFWCLLALWIYTDVYTFVRQEKKSCSNFGLNISRNNSTNSGRPHDQMPGVCVPIPNYLCSLKNTEGSDTKLNSRRLKVKTHLYYITYIYIYIYIYQTMVTANNYMFRPLTGHHHVVHLMKRLKTVQYTM